jgi:hypothetical protein
MGKVQEANDLNECQDLYVKRDKVKQSRYKPGVAQRAPGS